MRRILTALGLLGLIAASVAPAFAQYYGPGYGYAPDPYYRAHPRAYGGEYYGPRQYRRGYGPRYYAGADPRPHYDPRNGGFFCADPRFTVQDGICKPYRGF